MSREPACSTCGPGVGKIPDVVFAVRNKETGEYLFNGRTYKTRASLGRHIVGRSWCPIPSDLDRSGWELVKLRLVVDESEDNWS